MKSITEGSFWEHLEELRHRLFYVLGVLAGLIIVSFFFSRQLMALVLSRGPAELQTLAPTEAFSAHLSLSLLAGILISSPVIFYQFWRFVSPGLREKERKTALRAAFVSVLLFLAGAAFAWFLMLEPAINVFKSFETGNIVGHWSLANYIGFLGRVVIIFGIAFQLPVLVLMLISLGVTTPDLLAKYRRHIVVGLLIAAAILTPPDPLTQVMLMLPLYLLFELSLLTARIGYRKRNAS
ncbi:MAG: twin-arginine translocase subunit TatC [Candidatus Aegiribacteria sp.]|nr:twin-arginine translocase subunit TatC [Candidatus Aegiribacteria sp.]